MDHFAQIAKIISFILPPCPLTHCLSELPAKQEGEEMSEGDKKSKKKKRKKDASSSAADEGLRGLFARTSLPGVNGHVGGSLNIQDAEQEERERLIKDKGDEEEEATWPQSESRERDESREAKLFRITSVGDSEKSSSVTVPRPVIKVTVEDYEEEDEEGKRREEREKELAGGTLPTAVQRPAVLEIPSEHKRRGGSAGPHPSYGLFQGSASVSINRTSPSHSPSHSPSSSPNKRRMRKTISGESVWYQGSR